jgi:hypothetical protein
VEVKTLSVFLPGLRVGSDDDWQPLDVVLAAFPVVSNPVSSSSSGSRRMAANADQARQHPWLLDLMGDPARGGLAGVRRPAADGGAEHGGDGVVEVLNDEDVAEVFDALHERRAIEALAAGHDRKAFCWTVLGGAWTMEHKGVAFDSYRGQPQFSAAKDWATSRKLFTTATFSLAKYGQESAVLLVKLWCDKMNHFYEIGVAKCDGYEYTDADVASFVEPPEFVALFGNVSSAVELRLRTLRGMRPL